MDRAYLDSVKKHGKDWYEYYASRSDYSGLEVIITPYFHPNPLKSGLYIYKRRTILDMATNNAARFFENIGMKSIVSGPTGLGASVTIPISTIFAILRFSIQIVGHIAKWYRGKIIKNVKPSVTLRLSLCIEDSDAQLGEYAKQFVICVAELIKDSERILPFVNLIYPCDITDLSTEKSISFCLKNGSNLSVLKQLRKIDKSIIFA